MAEERHCSECGGKLPADAPQGLCPQCLMKLGLPTGAEADKADASDDRSDVPTSGTPPGRFVPPEPAQLARQFPQLEILELLGQGGMGAVYKARQKQLDRLVALKILPPEVGQTEAFAERFTREARSMAKLNHPHIVTVHEFGQTEEGLYYFIMEFVDGTDLRRVIQAGELEPSEALAIVPQICEALQYAHEEGIVHRDIKPENVLLDKKGRVKIADFGLARLLDRPATAYTLTQAGQRMGTPHYMAPEQIEHPHEVDHRADIFSLGVVFYEMLTGQLPIGKFAPPSTKVQVDVRLDRVVLKTLEYEPERRYQHASEIKTDVESIATDVRPVAPPSKHPGVSAAGTSDADAPRICKLPVIGAMWAPFGLAMVSFFFFAKLVYVVEEGAQAAGPPGRTLLQWILLFTVLPLGVLAPFVSTTLGCLGISKIRSSQGQLIGMPLAVAVALFYPILVLDGILLFIAARLGDTYNCLMICVAVTALVILALDFFIIRAVWKAVTKSPGEDLPERALDLSRKGKWNGFCIAGFLISLVGIFFSIREMDPGEDVPVRIIWALSIAISVVFAGIGLWQHSRYQGMKGKGFGIAALVIALAALISFIVTIWYPVG